MTELERIERAVALLEDLLTTQDEILPEQSNDYRSLVKLAQEKGSTCQGNTKIMEASEYVL